MKLLAVPQFDSEAEEIDWWCGQLDTVEENLVEAMRDGMARRGCTARILSEARKQLTGVYRHVTIRILEEDLELARQHAQEHGLTHQNYIALVLHEAMTKRRGR